MIFVIDGMASKVRLHRLQDGKLVYESDRLKSYLCGICVINDKEITVILSNGLIKMMSIDSTHSTRVITWTRNLRVQGGLDEYRGVVSFKDNLVVCGVKQNRVCWCIVSSNDGHVGTIHQICKESNASSFLSTKDNIIYISCDVGVDSPATGVYAYDVQNPSKYKYRYKNKDLKEPKGIVIDQHGYLFVCNYQYPYDCIHHLTSECQLVSILKQGLPRGLYAIFWDNGHLYVSSFHINHITRYRTQYPDPIIPSEVLNMDTSSIEMYKKALRDGTEKVYNIRVMVVGPYDVGKTTLMKRLLGKDVNINDRQSTEGIDIKIECCKVSLTTGEWITQEKNAEQDYQLQRLAKVVTEKQSMRDKVVSEDESESLPQGEKTDSNASVTDKEQVIIPPQGEITLNTHQGALVAVEDKNAEVIYRRSPQFEFNQNLSSTASKQEQIPASLVKSKLTKPDTNTMAMLKSLKENAAKLKPDTGTIAPLSVWDFAGQFAFYTTHQTFLARRAIYLLVSDVSGEITDIVADECYFDSEGIIKRKVYELIGVWLNSIHCCAPSPEAGIPPVILVGTHVDKISQLQIARYLPVDKVQNERKRDHVQKQLPAKGVKSETQTMMSERVDITLPTTSTHADTFTNEQPRPSALLRSVWKFVKSRKSKRTAETPTGSSMTGPHPIPGVRRSNTQRIMKAKVDAEKEKASLDVMQNDPSQVFVIAVQRQNMNPLGPVA